MCVCDFPPNHILSSLLPTPLMTFGQIIYLSAMTSYQSPLIHVFSLSLQNSELWASLFISSSIGQTWPWLHEFGGGVGDLRHLSPPYLSRVLQ